MRGLHETNSGSAGAAFADRIIEDIIFGSGGRPKTVTEEERRASQFFDKLFTTAFMLDILNGTAPRREPGHQDRLHSAIDVHPETPFFRFWRTINERLVSQGKPELGYEQAKTAFAGGPTPFGSMTFIGNKWDGIRAVPATPVVEGGARPKYHGECREQGGNGTVWHKVVNHMDQPVVYDCPENACVAARALKQQMIDKAFR